MLTNLLNLCLESLREFFKYSLVCPQPYWVPLNIIFRIFADYFTVFTSSSMQHLRWISLCQELVMDEEC